VRDTEGSGEIFELIESYSCTMEKTCKYRLENCMKRSRECCADASARTNLCKWICVWILCGTQMGI